MKHHENVIWQDMLEIISKVFVDRQKKVWHAFGCGYVVIDKSLPQHVLGFSVRQEGQSGRGVTMRILTNSTIIGTKLEKVIKPNSRLKMVFHKPMCDVRWVYSRINHTCEHLVAFIFFLHDKFMTISKLSADCSELVTSQ